MKCTFLKPLPVNREYTEVFGGYDSRARISDGQFADMQNLSSHAYPLMATRRAREVLMRANGLQGVIVKDKAAWVADGKFYYDGKLVEGLALTEGEQSLVSMGARIIIFPDMASYNTATGEVEMLWTDAEAVELDRGYYDEDNNYIENIEHPRVGIYPVYPKFAYPDAEMAFGLESGDPHLAIWDDDVGRWKDTLVHIPPREGMYLYEPDLMPTINGMRPYRNIKKPLYRYISGTAVLIDANHLQIEINDQDEKEIKDTWFQSIKKVRVWDGANQARTIICDIKENQPNTNSIIVEGDGTIPFQNIDWDTWKVNAPMTPFLDGLLENGNRLWGWRYGEAANGETVNEIYSTALGDPKAWSQFEGIASDSYAVGVGSDGVFTGAAYYSGSMYFFKENCYHRIVGKKPSNYQLLTVTCTGVEIGSEKSLVTAGDALYYKGEDGFYRFDGSIPYKISDVLGDTRYRNAVGGVLGDRIYWDCETDGGRVMLVYDLVHKLWYKESSLCAREMVPAFGNLLVRGEDGLYLVDGENVDARFGEVFVHEGESVFEWFGELGDLGLSDLNAKYVSRIVLRTTIEEGARVTVSLLRDSKGDWETVAVMNAKRKETASVPITVPRCDHFRIRIEGVGGFKLWGLARDIEKTNEIRR